MREITDVESTLFNVMFETRSEAQSLADEQLAEMTLTEYTSKTLEITLNVQRNASEYKKLSILQKKDYLSLLFKHFCDEYKAESSYHVIEYCKDGEPHLHGYVNLKIPDKVLSCGTTEVLRMYARTIFISLPRIMYKQFATANIDIRLQRFKTTGLCINMKSVLEEGWINYMKKTH